MKQHLMIQFKAKFPKTEFSRIYNADYLADKLSDCFNNNGIIVTNSDLWKDSGWNINCAVNNSQFDIYFAKYFDDSEWELTIEPVVAGFFNRLFGKQKSYLESDLKILAESIHQQFSEMSEIQDIKYCLQSNIKYTTDNPAKLHWAVT